MHHFDTYISYQWRRKWQPSLVFLPGKSHRQMSQAGYTPWGRKASDMTEWAHVHKLPVITSKTNFEILVIETPSFFLKIFKEIFRSLFHMRLSCFLKFICCSVALSCLTLWDPMGCSTPDLPVPHHLLEFAQVYTHCIGDTVQPSHPVTHSSISALNLSPGTFPMSCLLASAKQNTGA